MFRVFDVVAVVVDADLGLGSLTFCILVIIVQRCCCFSFVQQNFIPCKFIIFTITFWHLGLLAILIFVLFLLLFLFLLSRIYISSNKHGCNLVAYLSLSILFFLSFLEVFNNSNNKNNTKIRIASKPKCQNVMVKMMNLHGLKFC